MKSHTRPVIFFICPSVSLIQRSNRLQIVSHSHFIGQYVMALSILYGYEAVSHISDYYVSHSVPFIEQGSN